MVLEVRTKTNPDPYAQETINACLRLVIRCWVRNDSFDYNKLNSCKSAEGDVVRMLGARTNVKTWGASRTPLGLKHECANTITEDSQIWITAKLHIIEASDNPCFFNIAECSCSRCKQSHGLVESSLTSLTGQGARDLAPMPDQLENSIKHLMNPTIPNQLGW